MTQTQTSENGVLKPLCNIMRCAIITNSKSDVYILHDAPFASSVSWLEYDPHLDTFDVVLTNGGLQPLGIDLPPALKANLLSGEKATLALYMDNEIVGGVQVPLIVKSY